MRMEKMHYSLFVTLMLLNLLLSRSIFICFLNMWNRITYDHCIINVTWNFGNIWQTYIHPHPPTKPLLWKLFHVYMARDMTLAAWFCRENIVRKQKIRKESCVFFMYIAMYLRVQMYPNVYTYMYTLWI